MPSVGSAEPELLHGGVSTSTSLPVSLSVVQRRKGEQREGNGGGGGEGEGGEARVRGAAGEVVLYREKAARGPLVAVARAALLLSAFGEGRVTTDVTSTWQGLCWAGLLWVLGG